MWWARLCKTFIVQAHELSKLQQVLHSLSALVLSLKKKKGFVLCASWYHQMIPSEGSGEGLTQGTA